MRNPLSADVLLRFAVKPLLFAACVLPFGLLVQGALLGGLGANPLERVTDVTGQWGLRLLLITLAVSPLRRLIGWAWLQRLRRMLGLFAFFYVSMHLLTWIWLDQELSWGNIAADIAKRPYVTVGFAAWVLLVPLAVTSTRAMPGFVGTSGSWQTRTKDFVPAGAPDHASAGLRLSASATWLSASGTQNALSPGIG